MTNDDLARIEALAKAATAGEWSKDWLYGALRHINRNVDMDAFFDGDPYTTAHPEKTDAEYIAAMHPQQALALIEEVRRLRKALESIKARKLSWNAANDMRDIARRALEGEGR